MGWQGGRSKKLSLDEVNSLKRIKTDYYGHFMVTIISIIIVKLLLIKELRQKGVE